ncbi:MAG TPA: hypothetical protein VLU38_00320 [Methanomassiliicoccales archaeon]|nr:hypothetical protein [Methanomassiliicoccales archaeon]
MRNVRFRGVKATPKGLEKDLLEKSRLLAKDPSLLLPKCEQACRRCPFDKLLRKMEKVERYSDDPDALISMASHGDQLVRAYAATISLAASGKIPFLTVKELPSGTVSFAVRGKVDQEKLIGVQYFDDPDLRLLAFWDIARDDDLHIYSEETGLKCADEARAPKAFVREALADAPYELTADGSCGHPGATLSLTLDWKSASTLITVCSECASDVNLLHGMTSRIAARDPTDDFKVEVRYSPKCVAHSECPTKSPFSMSAELMSSYRKGSIDDATLIARFLSERKEALRRTSGELYILGNDCYGRDKEAFIKALKGSEAEVTAIAGLVRSKPMVILSPSDQTAKVVADLWGEAKEALLNQVASPDIWKPLQASQGSMPPGQMIQESYRLQRCKGIIDQLPQYSSRGPIGALADDLARAYKSSGRTGLLQTIDRNKPKEHRGKAVVYAFLAAVGEAESRAWQFTTEEKDFGKYLADFVKVLLDASGDAYHEALENMLTASGSGEGLQRRC